LPDTTSRRVGTRELIWFFALLFISKILFADIGDYVKNCGSAGYILTAAAGVFALVLFVLIIRLADGETDIIESAGKTFGKWGMRVTGVIITLLLVAQSGIMIRVYTDIISSIVLPESSDVFIMLFLVAAVFFAAFAGTGTLAAYSYVAGIIFVITLAVILVLNIPNYDVTNIYPLLGKGITGISAGVGAVGVYSDMLLLFLVAPYLTEKASVKKGGIISIVISAIVITVTTLSYIMTVEYPFSSSLTLPVLEIAFDVNLDIVFQRAEGLFFFLWIFSGFIVTGAYLCFALVTFVKSFNLTDRRAPIGAFVFVAACIALIAGSSARERELYRIIYSVFAVVSFALPLFVFGIKKFKRRQIK